MVKKLVINLDYGQGLGNQLWCIFCVIGLAERFGRKAIVGNFSEYKGIGIINFTKNLLIQNSRIKTSMQIMPIKAYDFFTGLDYSKYDIDDLSLQLKGLEDVELVGHIQDINFLPSDIFKYFTCGFSLDKGMEDTVYVHIRGGDYKKTLVCPPRSYYLNAISMLKTSVANTYVVTDDPCYANKLLPESCVIENEKSVEDFSTAHFHSGSGIKADFKKLLMAKNCVIGASTFSFWPAYLGKILFGSEKRVIAPHNWYSHRFAGYPECPSDTMNAPFTFIKSDPEIFRRFSCFQTKYQFPAKFRRLINIAIKLFLK